MQLADGLPEDIRRQAERLAVDRRGNGPDAFMVTEGIVGHAAAGRAYKIADAGLVDAGADASTGSPHVATSPTAPPHARLTGTWQGASGGEATSGNIFGGVGTLTLDRDDLEIPAIVATPALLGFYGASLIAPEQSFRFHADADLPVTVTAFGRDYVDGFLHVPELGGGSYIEFHDLPHLHMPLDPEAAGYMLLGRQDDGDYLITAFRIPYGYALYTAPEVLHADGYLTGRYMVIYGMTENYSNVVFRAAGGDPVSPVIRAAV